MPGDMYAAHFTVNHQPCVQPFSPPAKPTLVPFCPEDQIRSCFPLPSILLDNFSVLQLRRCISCRGDSLTTSILLPHPTPSFLPPHLVLCGVKYPSLLPRNHPSSVSFAPSQVGVVHRLCGQITTDPPAEATAPVRVHRDCRSSTQTCTPMICTMLNHQMIIGPDTILVTTIGEPMTAVRARPGTGRPIDLPTAAPSMAMATVVAPLPSPEPTSLPLPRTATVFVSP